MLSTSLYFVAFGAAIGSRMGAIDGITDGAFIIPGLIMLSLLNESISNASFGIYMPQWSRRSTTCFPRRSPTLRSSSAMWALPQPSRSSSASILCFLVLAVTFSLFGFILGIWADGFEQVMPPLIITPLTFLGGGFYSIGMLPPIWQKVTLFNPVGVGISVRMTLALAVCLTLVMQHDEGPSFGFAARFTDATGLPAAGIKTQVSDPTADLALNALAARLRPLV